MPFHKRKNSVISFWRPGRGLTDLLCSSGLRNGKTDSKDGIGAKLCLIWGTIELDQELINLRLVLNIDILLDDGWTNDFVDIGDCLQNTFSAPFAFISIAELACLVLT